MKGSLEEILREMSARTPIESDEALEAALEEIIKAEEARGITEENASLVGEATELLLSIRGDDTAALDEHSAEVLSDFCETGRSKRSGRDPFAGFSRAARRVAVFSVAILSALTLTLMLNGEARAAVRSLTRWFSSLAVIDFSHSEETSKGDVPDIGANVIPEGFVLETESRKDGESLYVYRNSRGDSVIIEVIVGEPSVIVHRTEEHEYEEMSLGDVTAYSFYSDEEGSGSILFGDKDHVIMVSGSVEYDVLLSIASKICGE